MFKFIEKIKNITLKYKGYIICIIIIIISGVSLYLKDLDRKNTLKINNEEIKEVNGKIGVYVTGAVKNPGVYYLDENSRVYHLLDICGGLLDNADISKLNLAQKLVDSDKIEIPVKKQMLEEMDDDIDTEELYQDNEEKININTADISKLQTLSGIGKSTANKIIEYRNNNKFETPEDIMNVPGIGESKYNQIKDSICTK